MTIVVFYHDRWLGHLFGQLRAALMIALVTDARLVVAAGGDRCGELITRQLSDQRPALAAPARPPGQRGGARPGHARSRRRLVGRRVGDAAGSVGRPPDAGPCCSPGSMSAFPCSAPHRRRRDRVAISLRPAHADHRVRAGSAGDRAHPAARW